MRLLLAEDDRLVRIPVRDALRGAGFDVTECADGTTEIRQSARFKPRGLLGLLYWYSVLPFHNLVFAGMLRGIARAAGGTILAGPDRLPPRGP